MISRKVKQIFQDWFLGPALFVIMLFTVSLSIFYFLKAINQVGQGPSILQKPFIIYLDSPSLEDIKFCKQNPNCMDVLDYKTLPNQK